MNTPTRFVTAGLAGCLCSTLLYALAPGQLDAGDRPPRHRHSLITRPGVAAAQTQVPETVSTPQDPDKFKRLSLVAPTSPTSDSTTLPRPQAGQPGGLTVLPEKMSSTLPATSSQVDSPRSTTPRSNNPPNSRSTRRLLSRLDVTGRPVKPFIPAPGTPTVVVPPASPAASTPVVTAPQQPSSPTPTPVVTPPPPSSSPPAPSFGTASLTWNPNPDTDLAGYKVHVGTNSGTYTFAGPFDTQGTTNYTVGNLPKGQTYYFAVSAYDASGNESLLSTEVSKSIVN